MSRAAKIFQRGSVGRPPDTPVVTVRKQETENRATITILPPGSGADTLVWRGDAPLQKRALIPDALAFARSVPSSAEIVNCCRDRYNFSVVFAGCLLRGKPAILPHDERQSALLAVAEQFQNSLFITDHPIDAPRSLLWHVGFSGTSAVRSTRVPEIPHDQTAAILFTSGSTGRAVPIARTWQWLVEGANDYVAGLSLGRFKGLTIVSTVPPQHSFGLEATVMLPLRTSAAVLASRPFFPKDVIDALTFAPKPTALVTTPFHLELILRSNAALPSVQLIMSATSPLSKELAREAETATGGRVHEVYGCSEVGLVGTRRTMLSDTWTPGASLTLSGAHGRAFVSARHFPARIHLPDSIALAADGTFSLGGRSNDIVKIAGHRASLAGLNAILRSIPGVVDGAIVCRPSETAKSRTRLAGFVVLAGRSIGDVKRELRSSIAGPFMPRPLLAVSDLPRSSTGKIVVDPLLSLIDRKSPRS